MPPETNTASRSSRAHLIGTETVWAQSVERMDRHLLTAMGLSGILAACSHDTPDGGGLTSPRAAGLLAAVLDQLLAGADPRTVFLPKGLLEELKTAPAGYFLAAGVDRDLARQRTGGSQTCVIAARPA